MLVALGSIPVAATESIVVGVNIVSPQRLSAAAREAVLDQLRATGVRMIRAPLAPHWGGDDYGPAIDFIQRAYERGIKTDLIVGLQYREGAEAASRQRAAEYLVVLSAVERRSGAVPDGLRAIAGSARRFRHHPCPRIGQ
jgi:hypothetical protein